MSHDPFMAPSLGRLSGVRRQYAAIDPEHAVDALIRTRAAELGQVRSTTAEPARLFSTGSRGEGEEVEIVHGSEALGRWFVRLQQEARTQVRTLDRPPYALTTTNPVEETALAKNVTYRAVYAPEALEWPGVRDDIRRLIGLGEQARVLPQLRVKLAIADDRVAGRPGRRPARRGRPDDALAPGQRAQERGRRPSARLVDPHHAAPHQPAARTAGCRQPVPGRSHRPAPRLGLTGP
jgi:hypothetical protein